MNGSLKRRRLLNDCAPLVRRYAKSIRWTVLQSCYAITISNFALIFAAWLGWLLSCWLHTFIFRWLGRIDLNSLIVAKSCDGTKARAAHKHIRTQMQTHSSAFTLVAMLLTPQFIVLAGYHITTPSARAKRVERSFQLWQHSAECNVSQRFELRLSNIQRCICIWISKFA